MGSNGTENRVEEGLPSHKAARLWKFDREEVDGWVRSRGGGNHAGQGESHGSES